jgi:hypothetical protein
MRNRTSLFMVAALVAASAFVTMASAQETKPTGLTVRAGAFFPSLKETRDATKSVWFTAGLDYKIGTLSMPGAENGQGAYYSISADYAGQSNFYVVPVLLNYVGHANEFFYSVGAGVTFAQVDFSGNKDKKSVFGYRLAIGYEFSKSAMPVHIEAGYLGASGSEVKDKLNGIFVDVGVRF